LQELQEFRSCRMADLRFAAERCRTSLASFILKSSGARLDALTSPTSCLWRRIVAGVQESFYKTSSQSS
jgi:hypothetical protein